MEKPPKPLRIKELADAAALDDESPTIRVLDNLWLSWVIIAAQQAGIACAARERSVRDASEMGTAIGDEFAASLVAVTSSAFSLEALSNYFREHLGVVIADEVTRARKAESESGRVPAFARVVDAIRTGSHHEGLRSEDWEADVEHLFDLRNDVVHFRAEWHGTTPHPNGQTNVSPSHAVYAAEVAARSVDLAIDTIAACLQRPRPECSEVVTWAESMPHMPPYLDEIRATAHPT